MPVRIVRLGSPRHRREGLRIGTVRRPPRGVRKSVYALNNWYDVWLPALAPSAALLRKTSVLHDKSRWRVFERRYRSELKQPEQSHLLDMLAALSHQTNFSIGCYCQDEPLCHRSILRQVLRARGAKVKGP
jgi:uncharacterized protein YeaO (DUF488 family)